MKLKPYFFVLLLVATMQAAAAVNICTNPEDCVKLPPINICTNPDGCVKQPLPPAQPAPTASASSVDESKRATDDLHIPKFPKKAGGSTGLIEFVTPVLVSKSKSCS